ncbi:MAG: hypothetical protein IKG99_02000 [Bacteroidaceae bacterium]|nr:hypothetical protein [Bacteroidaceae bacterium]
MKHLKLLLAALFAMFGMNSYAQSWTGNEVTTGTFFLFNVGAQKYLNNGDPNQDWGTNAYLQANFGLDVTLEANGSDFNIRTDVSNGGQSYYLATSTWCDGGATPWTFTPIETGSTIYTISNGGKYLVANNDGNDVEYGALSGTAANNQWLLVSLDDFKAAMRNKTYSTTDPMDVSVFIKARSFARNDLRNNTAWVTSHNGGNWDWIAGAENKYYGNEAWNQTFDVHQAITDLPKGTYEVRCSGFGTNGTTYVYGNATKAPMMTDNTTSWGTDKVAKWKAIHHDNAFSGNSSGTFLVVDGKLTVGIKRETNIGGDWCIYDEFRLYYYGLDLSEFAATLAEVVAEAEALEGEIPTSAYNTLANVVEQNNQTYTTVDDYSAAIRAIQEAIETASVLKDGYGRYKNVRSAVTEISTAIDITAADQLANNATSANDIENAITNLRTVLCAYLPNATIAEGSYIDLTNAMVDNPTVSETTDFWTITGTPTGWSSWGVVNWGETEFYQNNFKFFQTVEGLPSGTFEFGVTGFHRAGEYSTYFYAGTDKILIPGVANTVVNSMQQAKTYFDDGNGKVALRFSLAENSNDVEIGIENNDDGQTDKWTIFRNFTLKYYGNFIDLTPYRTAWEEALAEANSALGNTTYAIVTGDERIAVQTAMADTPEETLESYRTKTNALYDAIDAFKQAKASYDALATAKTVAATYTVEDWPYASEAKAQALATAIDVTATSAEDATTKTNAIVNAYRLFVESNGMAEIYGDDVTNLSESIADWPNINTLDNERFTEGSGELYNGSYYDIWNGNPMNSDNTKEVVLPKGKYLLQVTARAASNMGTYKMSVYNGEEELGSVDLPRDGNTGGTFNRGWSDRFVVFEITEGEGNQTVTIHISATSEAGGLWFSFGRFRLIQIEKLITPEMINELYASITKPNCWPHNVLLDADVESTKAAVEAEMTVGNFSAFEAAVNEVKASADEYAQVKAALDEATTLYPTLKGLPEDEVTTYQQIIGPAQTAYTNGFIETVPQIGTTDNALDLIEQGIRRLVIQQKAAGADVTRGFTNLSCEEGEAPWYIADGTNYGPAFNFWSTEDDPSGMKTPFLQCWRGGGDNVGLEDVTVAYTCGTQTLGLGSYAKDITLYPNTVYEVTGFIRALKEYGENDGVTGLYIYAGDNEIALDEAAEGTLGEFNNHSDLYGHFSVKGVTDAQGHLTFGIRAEGTTTNWFAFKDFTVKYVCPITEISESKDTELATANGQYVKLTRTITASTSSQTNYNTLVLPFNLSEDQIKAAFGDDVKVYAYKGNEGNSVKFEDATELKANVPVLLTTSTASTDEPYIFQNVDIQATAGGAVASGLDGTIEFVGTYAAETPMNGKYFFSGSKIYQGTDQSQKMKGTRAYLTDNSGSVNALSLDIDGTEITAIQGIDGTISVPKAIYNLQGQKVTNPVKGGIYIIDGKKVLVK